MQDRETQFRIRLPLVLQGSYHIPLSSFCVLSFLQITAKALLFKAFILPTRLGHPCGNSVDNFYLNFGTRFFPALGLHF